MKNKPSRKKYVWKNRNTCKKYAGSNGSKKESKKESKKALIITEIIDTTPNDSNIIRNCSVTYDNGDKYKGYFNTKTKEKNGRGVMKYFNNRRKVIRSVNEKIVQIPKNIEYNGEWENDKKNKNGIMKYSNEDVYTGKWKDDIKHGFGIMDYSNGDVYEGEWKDDIKHGFGIMDYSNGDVYEGEWKDDTKHGKGKMEYSNGDVYTGEWKNNSLYTVTLDTG